MRIFTACQLKLLIETWDSFENRGGDQYIRCRGIVEKSAGIKFWAMETFAFLDPFGDLSYEFRTNWARDHIDIKHLSRCK